MKIFKIILVLFVTLILSSCERDCGTCCIEADDWGYPKVVVPAEQSKLNVEGSYTNQIARSIDSGQVLINAYRTNLLISVAPNDKWTAWSGGGSEYSYDDEEGNSSSWSASEYIPETRECFYADTKPGSFDPAPRVIKYLGMLNTKDSNIASFIRDFCASGDLNAEQRPNMLKFWPDNPPELPVTEAITFTDKDGKDSSFGPYNYNPDQYADCVVPCWLKYGMGLYLGLSPHNGEEKDINLTYHIPDSKKPWVPYNYSVTPEENLKAQERDGFLINDLPSEALPGSETYDRLYFKIVDKYYGDNVGGYTVKIKEGTRSPNPGALEAIVSFASDAIFNVMERIFRSMVANQEYLDLVRVFLTLFVVLYAFLFMMGAIEKPKEDLIINSLRIAVVVQLLSPTAYDFFYNYFFAAFLKGSMEIASLFMQGGYSFDPSSPWFSVDQLLYRFISGESIQKLLALIFSNVLGVVFVIVYFIGVFLLIQSVLKALMLYLVALVAMAVLVIIAPVIIVALLFSKTRDLFDEWVNHFIAFAIQIIVVFASIGIFAMVIIMFQERNLGFPVCWKTWNQITILGIHVADLKFYLPEITDIRGDIYMDWDYDGAREWYVDYNPKAYVEGSVPYLDLPYLDPYKDKDQILSMIGGSNFVSLGELILFTAAIFLMYAFMPFVQKIGDVLKGGAGSKDIASLFPGSNQLWNSMKRLSIGDQGSGRGLKGGNMFSKKLYSSGRDGGLLGGAMRQTASIGKSYYLNKAIPFAGKKAGAQGAKGLFYAKKGAARGVIASKESWNNRGVPTYEGPNLLKDSPVSNSISRSAGTFEKTKTIGGTKEFIKTEYNFQAEIEKQLGEQSKSKLRQQGGYKGVYAKTLTNIQDGKNTQASYLNKFSRKANLTKDDYKKVLRSHGERGLTEADAQLIKKRFGDTEEIRGKINNLSNSLQDPNLKDKDRRKLLKQARKQIVREAVSNGSRQLEGIKYFSGEQNYRSGYLLDKQKFLDSKEEYMRSLLDRSESGEKGNDLVLEGAGLTQDEINRELDRISESRNDISRDYQEIVNENASGAQSNEDALKKLEEDRIALIEEMKQFDNIRHTVNTSYAEYDGEVAEEPSAPPYEESESDVSEAEEAIEVEEAEEVTEEPLSASPNVVGETYQGGKTEEEIMMAKAAEEARKLAEQKEEAAKQAKIKKLKDKESASNRIKSLKKNKDDIQNIINGIEKEIAACQGKTDSESVSKLRDLENRKGELKGQVNQIETEIANANDSMNS